jgi:putative Holliday junction resolvase
MGRIMGLDLGDRRIGVAISDELRWTAQGLEVIPRTSPNRDLARLREIIRENEVEEIVIGLPRHMNGTYGQRAEISLQFAEELRRTTGLPVKTQDERLSTAAAQRTLIDADVSRARRKQVVDKMAAAVILQGYLDRIQ